MRREHLGLLHHRARAALKAFVALLDLDERRQPRPPAMELGPQRLDLRLERIRAGPRAGSLLRRQASERA